ncbi:MAG: peptidoglycan-binding protein [Candidatus Izemoplasmatales bacterium]
MIKKGDKGNSVVEIQTILSLLGYDLIVDGDFGKKTFDAVKKFQTKNGLIVDGIVGQKTMDALNAKKPSLNYVDISKLEQVDYGDLNVVKTCPMPENQYIKTPTSKTQIFLHFTAGAPSAKNTINYWNSNTERVATAYVVDGDSGVPYEAFHPDYYGWHLGIKGTNGRLDKTSIGIEICSYGPLKKKYDKFYAWPNSYTTTTVKPETVCELEEPFRSFVYYQKFTDEQIKNIEKLLVVLIKKYKIKVQESFDIKWLDYNQDVINKTLPGIWSHSTVRKDKFDIYPDKRVFEMLNRIAKQFN